MENREKCSLYCTALCDYSNNLQHFYRKLGYTDCGCLFPHGQAAAELFLQKQLQTGGKSAGTAK